MANYLILKKTRTQVALKVTGSGSVTIPLTEFALPDETAVAPIANINTMFWSVEQNTGLATVSRGGTPVQYLYGSDDWFLSQDMGFVETEGNDQDVTVNIAGGDGLVYLVFSKLGWQGPDMQDPYL